MRKFYFVFILFTIHSVLFTNLYAQTFTEIDAELTGVMNSSVAWGDYDNDGDLDILISGKDTEYNVISKIYKNDLPDSVYFTEQTSIELIGVSHSSLAWGDYDKDGDLDILLSGDAGSIISKVYKNDLPDSTYFSEQTSIALTDVYNGTVAWADCNNDGNLDVFLSGRLSTMWYFSSKIYRNGGNGEFTDINAGLIGVEDESVWGDYDKDGDLDILVTGYSGSAKISKIYSNNGSNEFNDINAGLTGVNGSSVAWGDYDNDGDLDILLSGSDGAKRVSKIYKNDLPDSSFFTEQTSIELIGIQYGSIAWGDYDNDGYLDILITGSVGLEAVSKVYRNNGDNSFVEQTSIELTGVSYSSVAWGDYDKDGDLDIVIAGYSSEGIVSKIYRNDIAETNLKPENPNGLESFVVGNNVDLKWNNSTDDHTLQKGLSYNLFIGRSKEKQNIKASMSNISTGNRKIAQFGDIVDTFYTIHQLDTGKYYWAVQAIDNSFQGSEFSIVDSFEVNFTNHITPIEAQIILPLINGDTLKVHESEMPDARQWKYSRISGGPYIYDLVGEVDTIYIPNFSEFGTYYIICESTKDEIAISNEIKITIPAFTQNNEIVLPSLRGGGDIDWGDYDNDGDLDVILTGVEGGTSNPITKIYRNDSSSFVDIDAGITNSASSVDWGDYDNDGFLDILLMGSDKSIIYKNNGDSTFTEQKYISLVGLSYGQAEWCDIDNNGNNDIIISGLNNQGDAKTYIYQNNGNNTFTEVENKLKACVSGDFCLGYFNDDDLIDIIIRGLDINGNHNAIIYKNNGQFGFVEEFSFDSITGYADSFLDIGDYDNDGDLDIFFNGVDTDAGLKIYRNDGNNMFTDINANIKSIYNTGNWIDYDNDGDLDLIVCGTDRGIGVARIFSNQGNDIFTEELLDYITGYKESIISIVDYDNDGDLDIDLAMTNGVIEHMHILYVNNSVIKNTKPESPTSLADTVLGRSVTLSWHCASDTETTKLGLSYNIKIGTALNAYDIISPNSDVTNGFHKIVGRGNVGSDTSFVLSNLPVGKYYWSVQTIDQGYLASEFASVDSFTISNLFNLKEFNISLGSDNGSVSWGDYDNDNDLDVIAGGFLFAEWSLPGHGETKLFKNEGNNSFINQTPTNFFNARECSIEWCDFNLDNFLDVLIAGRYDATNYNHSAKLYKNMGDGTFAEQLTFKISTNGVYVDWGDYNNDGYPDILLSYSDTLKVYKNNGGNSFSYQENITLGASYSKSMWVDFNNDGYLDILRNGEPIIVFKNNRNNTFSKYDTIAFDKADEGAIDIGDYNNDNYIDIIITGYDSQEKTWCKIFRNEKGECFSPLPSDLRAAYLGNINWGDYDIDGKLDFIITGRSASSLTKIYHNDGNNIFTEIESGIPSFYQASVAWGDADKDGGLDLWISSGDHGVWQNNYYKGNTMPNAPTNIKAEPEAYGIRLTWDRATDVESTEGGLSYNVQVRKDSAWGDIVNPMADTSGFRKVARIGNAQYNDFFILDSLPIGTYYWSVQAIDQSFMGGTWADEQSFTISRLRPDFTADTVCFGDSTAFKDTSLFTGTLIEKWNWDFGDDSISTEQGPKYVFKTPGKHLVKLTITDTTGASQSKLDTIFVLQKPEAIFNINDVCIGSMASVVNDSECDTLSIESWRWFFGDEDTVYQQYPGVHPYVKTGTYDIELSILAQNGCSDTISKPIIVAEYPTANIFASDDPTICKGDSLKLNVAYNPNYSYQWKVGSVPLVDADSSILYPQTNGNYTVLVSNTQITPACELESLTAISVIVNDVPTSPEITVQDNTIFCQGDSVILSVVNNPQYTYLWRNNNMEIGIESSSNTVKLTGRYSVKVTDSDNCYTISSNAINVLVNELPDKPIIPTGDNLCQGDTLLLSTEEQVGINYQWFNDGEIIENLISSQLKAFASGNYYLSATNSLDCSISSNIASVEVTEMPAKPVVNKAGYDVSDCPQEKQITLSVDQTTSLFTYQWQRNGVPMDGETESELTGYRDEGDYTVLAINGACENESELVSIYYNPELPDKPEIIATGPNVWYLACTNDKADQYEWYFNNELISGANEYLYVANQNLGIYNVRLAEENGCFVSSDAVTIPLVATGINIADPFTNLKIYPNPTPGVFTIEMDNQIYGELITRIFSQNAVEIFNIKFDKSTKHFKAQVDLSGQGKGMYIISFVLDKYKAERKLVVE